MKMFAFMKNCSKASKNIIISPNFILYTHYHLKYIYSLSFHKFYLLPVVFLILAFLSHQLWRLHLISSSEDGGFSSIFTVYSLIRDQLQLKCMALFIPSGSYYICLKKLTEPLNSDGSCHNIKCEEWTKDASLDSFVNEQKYRGDPRQTQESLWH